MYMISTRVTRVSVHYLMCKCIYVIFEIACLRKYMVSYTCGIIYTWNTNLKTYVEDISKLHDTIRSSIVSTIIVCSEEYNSLQL